MVCIIIYIHVQCKYVYYIIVIHTNLGVILLSIIVEAVVLYM